MSFEPTKIYLTNSLRNAVIGEVTSNMIAVSATYDGNTIHFRAHFYPERSPNDVESFSMIATLVIADFPDGFSLRQESLILAEGEASELLDCVGFLLQREPYS